MKSRKDLLLSDMAAARNATVQDGQCLAYFQNPNSPEPETSSSPCFSCPEFTVKHAVNIYEDKEIYRMLAPVRGICLIINNIDYQNKERIRHGSEYEGQQLERLFNQLGFTVRHYRNRTAEQIESDFQAASQDEDNVQFDAFIGIILSHGRFKDIIAGVDESIIAMDSILEKFNNKNCPSLLGKPKMFFVQACRGDHADTGIPCPSENVTDAISFIPLKTDPSRSPTWTDTVVCYSTIDGFASIRNVITGSWFGDALIKVFCERAWDTEFHHLLSMVNTRVSERRSDQPIVQSLELVYRGWSKKLFFNPGLYHV